MTIPFRQLMPGVLCCLTVAAAAQFLSDHYAAPQMLFALLLGLAFHFLSEDEAAKPGVEFASKTLLKTGVALLGFRITFDQISDLGLSTIGLVAGAVAATIMLGIGLSYLLGRRARFGVLTGGAVAICGASAALAIASILPKSETRERDTIFTVVAVTTLSTIAMVVYPIIASLVGFDDQTTGIFLGATIHDVAQVVGAGYSVSGEAGDVATVIKLFRVSLLVPVILLFTFAFASKEGGPVLSLFPPFIFGFCAAVTLNSFQVLPDVALELLVSLSRWLLVAGIVGIGIKTSFKSLMGVGTRAIAIISIETIFIALLVMGSLMFLAG
ncbi:YeiH family protein [Hoeflea prorocentri]|uniref:Sulfate exporter family transporter n=1 Tax=Hoeflea prorocentri TaxID=1922333 RepID=A0A9X3ZJT5_9HYPH|nr:putative sulfate exporter family transporter [Hoeflea prorocentri]MCY6383789.1 putative sulfate exporter family transporter [Hoeflea prorocentri]MDA5401589.1 putative sulfate exporter family transporter [Hoeflea prorocentri]